MQLYSKAHFAVRHAASKDATRYNLNGIHFKTDGTTEATDGHILCRVKAATPPGDEYPTVPGVYFGEGEALQSFILPLEAADRAVKSIPKATRTSMPVLSHTALDVKSTNENGNARFVATDIETATVTEGKKIEVEFPKTENVIPKVAEDAVPTFVLNLQLMERIIKAAKEFKGPKARDLAAAFYVSEGKDAAISPILIRMKDPNIGELEAVIMPMRL